MNGHQSLNPKGFTPSPVSAGAAYRHENNCVCLFYLNKSKVFYLPNGKKTIFLLSPLSPEPMTFLTHDLHDVLVCVLCHLTHREQPACCHVSFHLTPCLCTPAQEICFLSGTLISIDVITCLSSTSMSTSVNATTKRDCGFIRPQRQHM